MIGVLSSALEANEHDVMRFLCFPDCRKRGHGSPGNTNFLWGSLVSLVRADRGVTLDEELRSLLDALLSKINTFPVPFRDSWLEVWLGRVCGSWRNSLSFLNFAMSSFILSLVTACSAHAFYMFIHAIIHQFWSSVKQLTLLVATPTCCDSAAAT